jgi:hypothetical protein
MLILAIKIFVGDREYPQQKKMGHRKITDNPLNLLVGGKGFEPSTSTV